MAIVNWPSLCHTTDWSTVVTHIPYISDFRYVNHFQAPQPCVSSTVWLLHILLILAQHGCYVPEPCSVKSVFGEVKNLWGKIGSQDASRHQKKLYYEFF